MSKKAVNKFCAKETVQMYLGKFVDNGKFSADAIQKGGDEMLYAVCYFNFSSSGAPVNINFRSLLLMQPSANAQLFPRNRRRLFWYVSKSVNYAQLFF